MHGTYIGTFSSLGLSKYGSSFWNSEKGNAHVQYYDFYIDSHLKKSTLKHPSFGSLRDYYLWLYLTIELLIVE